MLSIHHKLFLAAAISTLAPAAAHSSIIQANSPGAQITHVAGIPDLDAQFGLGDTATVDFSVDTGIPDSNTSPLLDIRPGAADMTVTTSSGMIFQLSGGDSGIVDLADFFGNDSLEVDMGSASLSSVNFNVTGYQFVYADLQIIDFQGSEALVNDDTVAAYQGLNQGLWNTGTLRLRFNHVPTSTVYEVRYQLDISQTTSVPEPSSLSLLALGGLALARRRSR